MSARRTLTLLALAPLLVGFELLQSPNRAIENGNARMKNGKPDEALVEYDKAVKALPAEPGAHFDRGAALYALGRFDEAREEFLRATEAKAAPLKAAAFYNLGNSFFKTDKFGDAIAAYRRSLQLDPTDIRAKWNLELALKKKKEEDQKNKDKKDDKNKKDDKEKKDEKQDDKQDEQKQDDKKQDEQKQDDKKQDEQKQDDKKQDEQKQDEQQAKNEEQQKQEQKQEKKDETKPDGQKPEKAADLREIEAILDSLERSPKDLEKERARLRAVRRAAPSKDW